MEMAIHFYKYAESYTVLWVWVVIPLSYLALYLRVKSNSIQLQMPELEVSVVDNSTKTQGDANLDLKNSTGTVKSDSAAEAA